MVNWSDPVNIAAQAQAFVQVLLVLLGIYAWEILNTMSFDYNLLVKWRDFKVSSRHFSPVRKSDPVLLLCLVAYGKLALLRLQQERELTFA